ncbi:C25 family cysteine peptidase [Bacteroidota bacterium]
MKRKIIYYSLGIILSLFFLQPVNVYPQEIKLDNSDKGKVEILQNTYNNLRINNTVNKIKSKDISTSEGIFSELFIDGYTPTRVVGSPKLPVMRKLIEIPYEAEIEVIIENYDVTEYYLSDYGINYPIMPAQPPVCKSANSDAPFSFNRAVYRKNKYLEQELVKVIEVGISRGIRLAKLEISPVMYNPKQKTIRIYSNIQFEVRFNKADIQKTIQAKKKYYSPYFEITNRQVVNHLQLKDLITQGPVKYVIVADPMFQNALQPFVQWKKKKGYNVIEAYTNNPLVGTSTASIKSYLQSLYNAASPGNPAPSFVLFVGDVTQIPSFTGTTGSHITDLYYCEYTNDFLPEVYFGRFSANNVAELQPQINKTLEYEQYLMINPSFLGKSVLIAGIDATYGPDHGNEQVNYGTSNYFNTAHGINCNSYLYPNSGNNGAQIIQDVSTGVGFVNYTAHGSSSGWVDPAFTISNVSSLQNEGKYPLMVGNACHTNSFNYTECFGESLLRAVNKGAIGYIGATNSTYWDEDFYWAVGLGSPYTTATYTNTSLGMFDRAFHDHGEPYAEWFITQGQMNYAGNMAVTQSGSYDDDYYWEIYHLMGDPSLMVYFKVPSVITANYTPLLPLGSNTLSVTTEPFAYIGLSYNGTVHGAGFADSLGNVTLTIIPFTIPGTADLVITAQNKQPFIDSVIVASPQGPYVLSKNVYIKDVSGNNNSKVDYGENINLDVTLINYGNSPDPNVYAILSSNDPYINITDSVCIFGAIAANDTLLEVNAYSFSVTNFVPDQHQVVFNLSIKDSSNNSWNSAFNVVLNAPNFEVSNITIDDNSTGNGNGWLDPGETVEIRFNTKNSGHADAMNTNGYLTSSSSNITVNNSSHNFNTFIPGTSSEAVFTITISGTATYGNFIDLNYVVNSGPYNSSENYQIIIGAAKEDWESATLTKFNWVNDGFNPWTLTNVNPFEGIYAAKSGNIGHMEATGLSISLNIITAGDISFYRKVSSEGNYDFLEFYIDGALKDQWSGEKNWDSVSYPVTTGMHKFEWVYSKDIYVDAGDDCGWIDYINFPPFAYIDEIQEYENEEFTLNCFPNPASDMAYLTFHKKEQGITDIEVYNMIGEIVNVIHHGKLSAGSHKFAIPLNNYQNGIYLVILRTTNLRETQKLFVVH